MGASVFLNSWTALAVALAGGTVGPFVYQFWFSLTTCLVWFIYLAWVHPDLVRRRDMWAWIVRMLPTRHGALAMLNSFGSAFFVWSALFLDTALVTIITSAWLIPFVAIRRRHGRGRYRRMGAQNWLLLGVAMAGVALVTLSQTGSVTTEGGWRVLWGVLLAAASAVCASLISSRFKLGTELYRRRNELQTDRQGELACVIAVSLVTHSAGVLGGLLLGLTVFPSATAPDAGLAGFAVTPVLWVIAGAIASSLGNIAFRYANLETTNLGVNAMQYLRTVLALVWLATFATINVARPDFLWDRRRRGDSRQRSDQRAEPLPHPSTSRRQRRIGRASRRGLHCGRRSLSWLVRTRR